MSVDIRRFKHPVNIDLLCCQCGNVPLDARLSPCNHLFCVSCLNQLLSPHVDHVENKSVPPSSPISPIKYDLQRGSFQPCPRCNKTLIYTEKHKTYLGHVTPPHWMLLKLASLEVKCRQGCGEVLNLCNVLDHERKRCPRLKVSACPNARRGCSAMISQREMKTHVKSCPFQTEVCGGCGAEVLRSQYFKHQCQYSCVQRALRNDMNRSQRRCHSVIQQHNTEVRDSWLKTMQLCRKVQQSHYGQRGCKGFGKWADPPFTDRTIENSSRLSWTRRSSLATTSECNQCHHIFDGGREEHSCQWHLGPITEMYGGVCMACGRLSHTKGCLFGPHEVNRKQGSSRSTPMESK